MARVQGQPSLAISGMSAGELTLWRLRGETVPAEAVAALKLDLDGSLWDSRGQFGGLLWPNETALLHPDWLRRTGAVQSAGVSDQVPEQVAGAPASEGDGEDDEPPDDPPIRPVYPIEELALALAGGEAAPSAWRILRWALAAVARRIARRSIRALANSGKELDPSDKGRQLTRAGRALQKHGGRMGSSFPAPKGNPAQLNWRGQEILEKILNDPASTVRRNNRFHGVDVIAPNGQCARFDSSGRFMGFLEP